MIQLESVVSFRTEFIQEKAGFFRRMLACVIDTMIVMLIVAGYDFVSGTASAILLGSVPHFVDQLGYIILPGYFGFWHAAFGKTPGKKFMNLKLVKSDGSKLSPVRLIVRTLLSYLSAFFFGIGFLPIIIHPNKQSIHDMLTDTYVIWVRN